MQKVSILSSYIGADSDDISMLDMADIDGMTLDNVEAAGDFIAPPNGNYSLGVKSAKVSRKQNSEGEMTVRVIIAYFVRETLSLAADTEDPVPNGTLFSENFNIPEGTPYLKARLEKLLGDIAGVKLKDMLDFLVRTYGDEGKPFEAVLSKVTTVKGQNTYENTRFVKITADV